ncbi:hypothetical protein [Pelagibacterium montanilacus]|uniref:hypothetical protein n=1 Tax=Pelagibacterium montanilacus TaxID=2185280 RepID=UPI000F8C620D|nr:hypothetical protein [Pelagibacterium montanilacus]
MLPSPIRVLRPPLLAVLGLALVTPAFSQDDGTLSLQLNALAQAEAGCRTTFVSTNGLGEALDGFAIEIALFDTDGLVSGLSALDFGAMSPERTRVVQFTLPDTDCTGIGRILINDVSVCSGPADPGACLAALAPETRTDSAFGL